MSTVQEAAPRVVPAHWLPHGAAMVLVDHVEHWDATRLRATSARHRAPAHPLASADGSVAAVHLLELAAQAAAIHIGLVAAGGTAGAADAAAASPGVPMEGMPAPGMLAFARELSFAVASIAPDAPPLRVEVTRRAALPGGMAYAFEVVHVAHAGSSHGAAGTPALGQGVFAVVFGAPPSSGASAPALPGGGSVDHEGAT